MDFLTSMILKDEYVHWLQGLIGNRAVDLGKTECQRCGFCCALRPCIPTPDELENIAKYLKMSVKECMKKYFVIDSFDGIHKFIFPAKECQLDITGEYISSRRTYDMGYCVFYDKNKKICKIFPVRPEHARTSNCWDNNNNNKGKANCDQAILSWGEIDITKYCDGIKGELFNNVKE